MGIKFRLAALSTVLPQLPSHYVNKELDIEDVFAIDGLRLAKELSGLECDEQSVKVLNACFIPHAIAASPQQLRLQKLVGEIKGTPDIVSVQQLSKLTGVSVRTIQRYFKRYLGLCPKRLIRRYRLHQVLEDLEKDNIDISLLVERLHYTDQSHLIRDFREIVGVTPCDYLNTHLD